MKRVGVFFCSAVRFNTLGMGKVKNSLIEFRIQLLWPCHSYDAFALFNSILELTLVQFIKGTS